MAEYPGAPPPSIPPSALQSRLMSPWNLSRAPAFRRSRLYRGFAGTWAWKRYIFVGAVGAFAMVNYSVKKKRAWERDFIHDKTYLYWKIYDGGIVEAKSTGSSLQYLLTSSSDITPDEPPRVMSLFDVIRTIRIIEGDDRIHGIIADFSSTSIPSVPSYNLGLAQIEEIQQALLEMRRTKIAKMGSGPTGWRSVAFSDTFNSQGHFLLASVFDEVYVQPSGSVPLVGMGEYTQFHFYRILAHFNITDLGSSVPFFGRLAKWLGVDIHAEARAEFKSFVQPYIDEKFTKAQRENSQELLGDLNDNFMTYIARNRFPNEGGELGLTKVKELSKIGPFTAYDALKTGLIDGTTYRQDILDSVLKEEHGGNEDIKLKGFYHYHKVTEKALARSKGFDAMEIGVVYLQGTIGDSGEFGTAAVVKGLKEAGDDEEIGAVVLRIDSGGGGVVESDTIWAAVRDLREKGKPVVASFGNVSASGGYYVSTHADAILVSPSTVTGSIGVGLLRFAFLQQFFDRLHITLESIFTGSRTTDVTHKLSPDELERLKGQVDETYADFKGRVCQGREISPDLIDLVAGGRVMTGLKAFSLNAPSEWIDQIKGLALPALTSAEVPLPSAASGVSEVLLSPLEDTERPQNGHTPVSVVTICEDQDTSPYAPPESNTYRIETTGSPSGANGSTEGSDVVETKIKEENRTTMPRQYSSQHLESIPNNTTGDESSHESPHMQKDSVLYLSGVYPILSGAYKITPGPFGRGLVDGLGGIRDAALCAAQLFIQNGIEGYVEENPGTSTMDALKQLLPEFQNIKTDEKGDPLLEIDVRLKRFPAEKTFVDRIVEANKRGDGLVVSVIGQYVKAAVASWIIKTAAGALASELDDLGLSRRSLGLSDPRKGLGIGHATRKNWMKAEWHGLNLS